LTLRVFYVLIFLLFYFLRRGTLIATPQSTIKKQLQELSITQSNIEEQLQKLQERLNVLSQIWAQKQTTCPELNPALEEKHASESDGGSLSSAKEKNAPTLWDLCRDLCPEDPDDAEAEGWYRPAATKHRF
jgi:hypothetical protein